MQDQGDAEVSDPLLSPEEKGENRFKGVYRKLCWNILPWLFLVAFVCYVDRTNLSLAAEGMGKDIGLTKIQYGMSASLFFVTYIALQIPSNYVLVRVGAPVWMGVLLVGWGLTASLTAFIQNVWQLYALRLVLGAFEAGTFPGINYYTSLFIPENHQAHFLAFVNAGVYAGLGVLGPISAGLLSMHGVLSISGWRWLLFLEGLPACVLGIALACYLPRNPSVAKFLTQDDRAVLEAELKHDAEDDIMGFWISLKRTVFNGPLALLTFGGLISSIGRYAAYFWTPLWIDAMASGRSLQADSHQAGETGGSEVTVALLSSLPYAFSAVSGILVGRSSSNFRDRKIHILVLLSLATLSFCLLPFATRQGLVVSMLFLTAMHITCGSYLSPLLSMVISVSGENLTGFALAWFNSVANLCGVIGPSLIGFMVTATGSYTSSFYVAGALCFLGGLLFLGVKDSLHMREAQKSLTGQP